MGEAGATKSYKDGRAEHINYIMVMGEAEAKSYKDGRVEHTNSVTGEAGAKSYKDGRAKRTNSLTGEAGAKSYKEMVVGNLQRQLRMAGNFFNKVLPTQGFRETNNV